MARITTGNTDILRQYYERNLGVDDLLGKLSQDLWPHWGSDVATSVTTGALAEIVYQSGTVVTLEGSNLDSPDPTVWDITELTYRSDENGEGFKLTGSISLDADYKIGPGSISNDTVIFDPVGGEQVLLADATSARLIGSLQVTSDYFLNVNYAEKSASWDDGLTFRVIGQTQDGNMPGSGDKTQTLDELIIESNGKEVFKIDDFGFISSQLTSDIIEAGPDAFIDYFLSGDDQITGTPDQDMLYAGAGNDVVDAGSGDDELVGGTGRGDDTYDGGTGSDTIKYTSATAGIRVDLSQGSASSLTADEALIGQDQLTNVENVIGGNFDDILTGDAQGNRLLGGSGSDKIDGDLGIDTAAYSGKQASHTIKLGASATTVNDRRADGDGTDTLTDIEVLDFAGETFDLSKFGGTAGLSEQNFEAFIELYIAYFNRAPDAVGLNFWGSAFANGMSLDDIAAEFAPQPETVATYPEGTSNTEFVTTVYNNILGRGPDQGGLDFWVNGLEEGGLTRDTFILKLLGGVEDGNSDRAYLDNKVDLGAYFAVHKGMSDGENAKAVMDLFGDQDVSNTSGAKTAIDDYYTEALDPNNGEFLLQVVGVLDNPFDVA